MEGHICDDVKEKFAEVSAILLRFVPIDPYAKALYAELLLFTLPIADRRVEIRQLVEDAVGEVKGLGPEDGVRKTILAIAVRINEALQTA